MPKDFWNNFQIYLRENRLPTFIVEILKKTGYDSPFSIELLDKEKVIGIEQTINKRFNDIKSIFEGTEYESIDTFEFLPGHVTLLLGIGVYVRKYLGKYLDKSFDRKKPRNQGNLTTINEDETTTEVEILSEDELEKLKESLVNKVVNYLKKYNLSIENISLNNIKGTLDAIISSKGAIVYKCIFCCGIDSCELSVPCIFNKHWQISNLERHIKTHIVTTRKPDAQTVVQLQKVLSGPTKNQSSNSAIVQPVNE